MALSLHCYSGGGHDFQPKRKAVRVMSEQGIYGLAAIILAAFGIALPLPDFAVGMFLSLGCCLAVMAVRPLDKRRAVPITLGMGVLAALIAAMLRDATSHVWLWSSLPVQAQMAAAGAFSQSIFELVAARSGSVLKGIADRAGLPGGD